MNNERKAAVDEVFVACLEKFAFMFAEPADDEPPGMPEGAVQVTMTYSGPENGRLTLAVAADMCPELAANILGLDPDEIQPASMHDALKELANITCGQLLTSIAGETPVFDMSVPEAAPIGAEAWQELVANPDTAAYFVDEHPVLLLFEMAG